MSMPVRALFRAQARRFSTARTSRQVEKKFNPLDYDGPRNNLPFDSTNTWRFAIYSWIYAFSGFSLPVLMAILNYNKKKRAAGIA